MISLSKLRGRSFKDPYNLINALSSGDIWVYLSCLFMGAGNIASGQIIKGLLFFFLEVAFLVFMAVPGGGIYRISMLPSLGDRPQGEVWNEELGIYEYTKGDNSQLILLYGIATILICVLFAAVWRAAVCSSSSRSLGFLREAMSRVRA